MKKILILIILLLTTTVPVIAKSPKALSKKPIKAQIYLYEEDSNGQIVEDGSWGKIIYDASSELFNYIFNGHLLMTGETYTLVFIPDLSLSEGLVCLGEGTANDYGDVHIKEAVANIDLTSNNWKIWLTHSSNIDCENPSLLISACTDYSSPGTIGEDQSAGNGSWLNRDNAKLEDGVFTSTDNHSYNHVKDFAARLILDDGSIGTTDYSKPGEWDSILQYVNYNNGLWNEILTPTIINDLDFGFALRIGGGKMTSHYLTATNFGFEIPPEATITNVSVRVKRRDDQGVSDSSSTLSYVDHIETSVCYDRPWSSSLSSLLTQ